MRNLIRFNYDVYSKKLPKQLENLVLRNLSSLITLILAAMFPSLTYQ